MVEIRTILCPVDFSKATGRQVLFATDLCRVFGAKLVLHHNLRTVGVGAAVGWMWSEAHQGPLSEEIAGQWLRRLMAEHASGVASDARLTHGPPTSTVLRVADFVHADVLVLTAHSGSHDDHMSMSEQILEQSKCAVLALHEPEVDHALPRFSESGESPVRVLVPTSFSETSAAAVGFAIDLARRLPLELHLLHIEEARRNHHEPDPVRAVDEKHRLLGMLPTDLGDRAHAHVATGDPASEIPAIAERLGAHLIVMGEHSRTSLLRWFKRDTGRSILHQAHCPVWYVP
jgi:nucleotide-binding universal stress UspA family protein